MRNSIRLGFKLEQMMRDEKKVIWFANACGVSTRTVNEWNNKKSFPEYAKTIAAMQSDLLDLAQIMFNAFGLGVHGMEFYDDFDAGIKRVVSALEVGDCCVSSLIEKTVDEARRVAIKRLIDAEFLEGKIKLIKGGAEREVLSALKEIDGSFGELC